MDNNIFELIIAIRKKCFENEEKIRNELNLSLAEYNGLLALNSQTKLFANDFSKSMGLSPSRGSRVIEKLVKNNFIQVEPVPNNRRSLHVSLSRQGISMQKKIRKKMEECEKRITANLTKQQLKQLKANLEMLVGIL